ncbi:hypothetical protein HZU75_13765 [Chitinibacter fontanus]|uniref:Uncharacterized protein n=1 Tax=Chitinibacter fontanus TaxID=1737446 RepID=A0A7D5ZF60_9NEIS|nr:hypothetical protein [Chitinibacter fontanus]QLI82506.1 hypothetical protein HZU75_13765 [Chitinibacter fontanus]
MPSIPQEPSSIQFYLRQARLLQRAVESTSPSIALPVLRRLLQAGVMGQTPLPQLFRTRSQLQRKHFLLLLAVEAGFPSWELMRPALAHMPADDIAAQQYLASGSAQLKLWFRDTESAAQYVAEHGGKVISLGQQAIVADAEAIASCART